MNEWIGLIGVVVGVALGAGLQEWRDQRQQARVRADWKRDHQIAVIEEIQRLMIRGEGLAYRSSRDSSSELRREFRETHESMDVLRERLLDAELRTYSYQYRDEMNELMEFPDSDRSRDLIANSPPSIGHFNRRAREMFNELSGA